MKDVTGRVLAGLIGVVIAGGGAIWMIGNDQARHEERLRVVEDAFANFLLLDRERRLLEDTRWQSDHDTLIRIASALERDIDSK